MKFDTIIIGGGLAGLLAGIRLQRAGQDCALISTGQSAMHFWSGAFDLLNRLPDGTEVDYPLEGMQNFRRHTLTPSSDRKRCSTIYAAPSKHSEVSDAEHIFPKNSATYSGSAQWAH